MDQLSGTHAKLQNLRAAMQPIMHTLSPLALRLRHRCPHRCHQQCRGSLTPATVRLALHACPQVLAPYAVVPGGSSLVYEVELVRLSAVGPDQLTAGISKCGQGGAGQQSENCANISYAEFL